MVIHEDSKKGGMNENVEHASWEEICKLVRNCANLTKIFANLLKNAQTIKQTSQTYSRLRKPK